LREDSPITYIGVFVAHPIKTKETITANTRDFTFSVSLLKEHAKDYISIILNLLV